MSTEGHPFAILVHPPTGASVTVADVMESITTEAAPRLSETLRTVVPDNPRLVLNLARCDYMASTGIGVLYYAKTQATKAGGDLRIANAPEFVAQMLDATLGPKLMRLFPDTAAAVESFADAGADAEVAT